MNYETIINEPKLIIGLVVALGVTIIVLTYTMIGEYIWKKQEAARKNNERLYQAGLLPADHPYRVKRELSDVLTDCFRDFLDF